MDTIASHGNLCPPSNLKMAIDSSVLEYKLPPNTKAILAIQVRDYTLLVMAQSKEIELRLVGRKAEVQWLIETWEAEISTQSQLPYFGKDTMATIQVKVQSLQY